MPEQESRLKMYAESQGWIIHDVLMDGGFSGGNLDRPGIQKVMDDARSHRINKILVYKLDRLSRSQKDTLYLIEDVFLKNGADIVSMTESLDTSTPLGMCIIGVLSSFAQLEKSNIAARMMTGRDGRVKSGKYHGNAHKVIGYDYDKNTGTLSQNPYDAMIVRTIFQWYAAGISEAQIAKRLCSQNWRGHNWDASKVYRILNQPLYVGRQRWRGEEYSVIDCPCVVSDELWSQVHREMTRRSATMTPKPVRTGEHKTLLGGLLWCGQCGCRYNGTKCSKHDPERYRYYCYSRIFQAHGMPSKECHNRGWRESELNAAIIEQISKLTLDVSSGRNVSLSDDFSVLEKRLADITKQRERLVDLYSLGNIDASMISKRLNDLQKQEDSIHTQMEEIKKPSGTLNAEEVQNGLISFREIVTHADPSTGSMELYGIVHKLIQSITLDGDDVRIVWNF